MHVATRHTRMKEILQKHFGSLKEYRNKMCVQQSLHKKKERKGKFKCQKL